MAEIGSEGMEEALNRRWIRPDLDSGLLHVTNDLAVVEEIRRAADTVPVDPPRQDESNGHGLAHAHALRNDHTEFVNGAVHFAGQKVDETLGLGGGAAGPASAAAPLAPPPPPKPAIPASPTSSASPKPQGIGDEVAVVENGQTYTGRIASMRDGKFEVSFGDKQPARQRSYSAEEVRLISPAQVSS